MRDTDAFTGPWQQTTLASVLVIGTRFVSATPYQRTKPYVGLFPRARVLTVNGYGLTALPVTRYLLTGATPAPGSTCRQDTPPFSGSDALRSGSRAIMPQGLGG